MIDFDKLVPNRELHGNMCAQGHEYYGGDKNHHVRLEDCGPCPDCGEQRIAVSCPPGCTHGLASSRFCRTAGENPAPRFVYADR